MQQAWIRGALVLTILALYWIVGLYPYTFQLPRYVHNEGAWTEAGGLVIVGPGMARTPDVPTWIQAIPSAKKLVLSVEVGTDHARQGGPARILTVSDGPGRRNLTLGRDESDLVVRIRRPGASENGSPEFRIADVFEAPVWRTIVVKVDNGRLRLAVDGVTQVVQDFFHSILSTWDSSFAMAIGNEIPDGGRPWKGRIRDVHFNVDAQAGNVLSPDNLVLPGGWWEVKVRPEMDPMADLKSIWTAKGVDVLDLIVRRQS